MEKVHVMIEVSGGVVSNVEAADFVDVQIVDWDELFEGDAVKALNNLPDWTKVYIKEHYPEEWNKITANMW